MRWASILLVLFLFSCRKHEKLSYAYTLIETGSEYPINHVLQINDSTILACGGNYQRNGFILSSSNEKDWQNIPTFYTDKKIECLAADSNGKIYAGSERGYYYESFDNGLSFQIPWQKIVTPFHEENRGMIKKFMFHQSQQVQFISGCDLNIGNVYQSNNGGNNWYFDTLFHELNDFCYVSQNLAWLCGHGYVGKWENGALTQSDFVGREFVGIHVNSQNEILLLSRKGKLYCSKNQGKKWDKIWQVAGAFQQRPYITHMHFISTDHGFLCGKFGLLFETQDGGESWKQIEIPKDIHLNRISHYHINLWIACDAGKVIKLNF